MYVFYHVEVILLIETSNRFSHLYVRNGKIVAALSLSIQFVVNNTGQGDPVKECIALKRCVVACNLNATLPLSVALNIQDNFLRGLLHTISIEELTVNLYVHRRLQRKSR
jgi:hypothetical protein